MSFLANRSTAYIQNNPFANMRYLLTPALCLVTSFVGAVDPIDFHRDVAPILQKHCAGCHNASEAEAGFALDSPQGLLAGGESGVALTPGASSSSRLWLMVAGDLEPRMPPEDEEALNEEQLTVIKDWIDQGASVSSGDVPVKRVIRTPKIDPREGIHEPITAMALSPDSLVKAVARFGKIELRNSHDSVVRTVKADLGKVNSLEFSRDGSRLLVASGATGAYGIAAVYAVATGELITELVGHRDILYSAVYSPDESLIATAGYDQEIILWNAETGVPIRSMRGHNGAIFDLAFAPDGKVIVSACADETVKVWSVATGQRLDTLGQSEGEVLAVDITSDGRFILATSADNRFARLVTGFHRQAAYQSTSRNSFC